MSEKVSEKSFPADQSFGSIEEEKQKENNRRLVCPTVNFSDIKAVMGLSHSSRALVKVVVHQGRLIDGKPVEGELWIMERPYIHSFIQARKGSFKSKHASRLMKTFPENVVSQDFASTAGIRGSISENGKFVPPLIWEWCGKTVIMDEVVKDRKGETTKMLLQLLEGNTYTYKLGRETRDFDSRTDEVFTMEDGKKVFGRDIFEKTGAFFTVLRSNVKIYSPFTLIMLSMQPLTFAMSSKSSEALLDRMLTVNYIVSPQEREDVEDGFYDFTFPIFNPSSEVDISVEEFIKIKQIYKSKVKDGSEEALATGSRILANMLRVWAIVKGTLTLDSPELDYLFSLTTHISGAYWVSAPEPQKGRRY